MPAESEWKGRNEERPPREGGLDGSAGFPRAEKGLN
jgi:hypothetical protein